MIYALDETILIDQFPRFFEDVRLNFAESMLCEGQDDKIAIIEMNEQNLWRPKQYSWKDLRELVTVYASSLRAAGLARGNVVTYSNAEAIVVIGSNCVRSLALLLATAALGGIFSSFATDIGEKALSDRLSQLEPHFLFAEVAYSYNGRLVDISTKVINCGNKLSCRCKLIRIGENRCLNPAWVHFDDFLQTNKHPTLIFEQVAFNTPLIVMFSSGTTGTPKGIVHSHGGLVLNGYKEHRLHNNFGPQDIHFHFSNIGWTLWNISIGALFCNSTMVLYDGSPFFPDPETFLKAVFVNSVTGFGASPRYFSELQKRNVKPKEYATKLHTLLSTGSILTSGLAQWLASAFGPVCQISFSGGTELAGSFLHGTPSMPSYPGEISVKVLGMDVAAYSPEGTPLPHGESGELVCRKPFPNMPVMFWNDSGRKKYFGAYFDVFPHTWTHGDFIRINPSTKGIYVLGRSDGTLNPSGVRFGSSEIYNVLSSTAFQPFIIDSIVVGQQRSKAPYSDATERVLLFIKVAPSASTGTHFPSPKLVEKITTQIKMDLTRRHVPQYVFEVTEIPYNPNGKKMEIQVKATVNGGKEAMTKMKLSQHEEEVIGKFVPFYDLEKRLKLASKI